MDNKLNKSFEESLRSKSRDFEMKPADNSWNKITAQLNQKRRRGFFFWIIPVAVSAGIAAILLFSVSNKKSAEHEKTEMISNLSEPLKIIAHKSLEEKTNDETNSEARSSSLQPELSRHKASTSKTKEHLKQDDVIDNGKSPSTQKSNIDPETINQQANNLISATDVITNENVRAPLTRLNFINAVLNSQNNMKPLQQDFEQVLKKTHKAKWSIGISFTPVFSNRDVKYIFQKQNAIPNADTALNIKHDRKIFAYGLGLDIYYRVGRMIYLHTGVHTFTLGETTFYDKKIYLNPALTFASLDFAEYLEPGSTKEHLNKYNFTEVPLMAGASLLSRNKTSLNIEAGAGFARLLNADAWQLTTVGDPMTLNILEKAKPENMNLNNFFLNSSLAFDWLILKNLSWSNGVNFKYQLNNMYKPGQLQSQHSYGYGFQTAFILHLK